MKAFRTAKSATVLILMLSCSSAWAQSGQSESAASPQQLAGAGSNHLPADVKGGKELASPVVAPLDPVVTIHGLCKEQPIPLADPKSCKTVITREQFETLLNSMNVTGKALTSETRRNLAETYAHYLALEGPATQAGLESTARFTEIMRWWRLRTLADMYWGKLQEQFKNPSQEEVHAYYAQHLSSYQRIKTVRILVPRSLGTSEDAKRADEKALQTATAARKRVAKGESPELVQKDAYSALQLPTPPITDLGSHPRSSFPTEETDELFSLEAGQVSKVETEGASYVVYKIVSKETSTEDAVKEEISRQIAQDKFNQAIRSTDDSAKPEFNEAFFGPPVTSPVVYSKQSATPHP